MSEGEGGGNVVSSRPVTLPSRFRGSMVNGTNSGNVNSNDSDEKIVCKYRGNTSYMIFAVCCNVLLPGT